MSALGKQECSTASWEGQSRRPTETTLEETAPDPQEPISASGEKPQTEAALPEADHPPTAGGQAGQTNEASKASLKGHKGKRFIAAALCVIAAAAAGIFLWVNRDRSGNQPDSKVDISEIANSVLYLEVFDENDAFIGSASGFLVNDQSTLVTNYHVVQDAYHIAAKTADGAQSVDVSCILAYNEMQIWLFCAATQRQGLNR